MPPDDTALLRVPGSRVEFTRSQVTDLFAAPNWHTDSPPLGPEVVAGGRKPQVHACGDCHLPDGQKRPENAPLAGLPAVYIEAQVAAFNVAGWLYVPTDGAVRDALGQRIIEAAVDHKRHWWLSI